MKNIGVVLAVATTLIIVSVIGVLNFLPATEPPAAAPTQIATTAVPQEVAETDTGAVQAAFTAREALIQSQIEELDRELVARQAAYEARATEVIGLIAAAEEQLAVLQEQELSAIEQLEALQTAQSERSTLYAGQREQAQIQYQVAIDQLKAQLEEAKVKLADAQAQLGQ
jgi:hypothetical protein